MSREIDRPNSSQRTRLMNFASFINSSIGEEGGDLRRLIHPCRDQSRNGGHFPDPRIQASERNQLSRVRRTVSSFISYFFMTLLISSALVVFYLLAMSWAAVFFTIPTYNRFVKSDTTLKVLSVFQSYLLFGFALALLTKAETFGVHHECNENAVAVVFFRFSALRTGRILGWIFVTIVIVIYTMMTFYDYHPVVWDWWDILQRKLEERRTPAPPSDSNNTPPSPMASLSPDLEAGQNRSRGVDGQSTAEGSGANESNEKQTSRHYDRKGKRSTNHKRHHKQKSNDNNIGNDISDKLGMSGTLICQLGIVVFLWALTVMNTELLIRWNRFEPEDGESQWQFGQVRSLSLCLFLFY